MGLEIVEVELGPGIWAGFTTRRGGVSAPPYASANLGLAVGDEPALVRANRGLLALRAGAPVAFARQVHGADVLELVDPESATADEVGVGDALVTCRTDLALAVQVADCVPVLLADPQAGVVATAHAGRAGVASGVVDAAVEAMVARGAATARIRAVVGPAVCGRCYEVGAELRAEVSAIVPAAFSVTRWGTPALDLPVAVLAQLLVAGVPSSSVTRVAACTIEDETYFSHRRASAAAEPTGRFVGVVRRVGQGSDATARSVG